MKYADTQVVFQEFPGEATLAINISGCPNHCPDCHSKWLWDDVGEELNEESLERLIKENWGITCVGFMGGDQDPALIRNLAMKVRRMGLKVGWYTGKGDGGAMRAMDFVKIGLYDEKKGPINKITTNQIYLVRQPNGDWRDETMKFWSNTEF